MRRNKEQRPVTSDLGPYGIVQRSVLGMVGSTAFAVYAALTTYADRTDMSCFPSIKTLARDVGKSDSTIQRAISELEEKGIVSITRQKRRDGSYCPNRYHIHVVPVTEEEFEEEAMEAANSGSGGVVASLRPGGSVDDRITVPKNYTNRMPECQGEEGAQNKAENQSPTSSYTINLGSGEVVRVHDPKQPRTNRTRARRGEGRYETVSKDWLDDGRLVLRSRIKTEKVEENLDQDPGRTSIPHTPTTFNDGWCAPG